MGRRRGLEPWKRALLAVYHLFRAASTTRESGKYYHVAKAIYHTKKLLIPRKARKHGRRRK